MFARLSHLRFLLALLAVVLCTSRAATGGIPVTYAPGVTYSANQQAIVNLMATTAGQGRAFLEVDPILTQVAQAQALNMAQHGYFSDVNPAGDGPNFLVTQAGYELPAWWGSSQTANFIESIAAGESTSAATWTDLMNSPPHREHLLGLNSFYAAQTSVGVGMVSAPNSEFGFYWVMITAPPNLASTVTIVSPANGATVTTPQIDVSGVTAGMTPAASVQIRVKNSAGVSDFQAATGVDSWTGLLSLALGANTITAQSLDESGSVLAQTSSVVTYIEPTTLTVSVVGNGTVTKGFLGDSTRNVGTKLSITATPAAGSIFVGWSGSSVSAAKTLSFVMTPDAALTATFEVNPFTTRTGIYAGLLSGQDVGLLSVNVGGTGAFTGHTTVNGVAYALHGAFGPDGTSTVTIPRGKNAPLVVQLTLDIAGTTGITATVTDGDNSSTVAADWAYNKAAGKFALAGRYNVVLPPDTTSSDTTLPQGFGVAALVINTLGQATFTGTLADGQTFTTSGVVSQDNALPVYIALYHGFGELAGTLMVGDNGVSDVAGGLQWIKPVIATNHIHPDAINETLPAAGFHYVPPTHGATVLTVAAGLGNTELQIGDGNLPANVTQAATLQTSGVITIPPPPALAKLNAVVNLTTGRFAGSFVHPVTHLVTGFHGLVCQRAGIAYGMFLGSSDSGYVSFAPVQ